MSLRQCNLGGFQSKFKISKLQISQFAFKKPGMCNIFVLVEKQISQPGQETEVSFITMSVCTYQSPSEPVLSFVTPQQTQVIWYLFTWMTSC